MSKDKQKLSYPKIFTIVSLFILALIDVSLKIGHGKLGGIKV
ncbi:hypothetical protein Pryu01_02005 [Paraliobacillus ryukyuensis]|uniref:Uncharacterized protein n=1 Tax=Paraliobacillus ryukyuensis TaxID=200904 RepID=A0A366DYY0_9BACI|nr:hypothetical protein [Paraliobacillus ryukyuensis]RBO95272.1 hypothetical protein DES48_109109 [Paraliobacillus ryukyuensis]